MARLFKFDQWNLVNLDTGLHVKGGFPAESVTENHSAEWAKHWALNRQEAIMQFLHGGDTTISFEAMLWKESVAQSIDGQLEIIRSFIRRDKITGRPPVLEFWVGDAHLSMICVMESLSVRHGRPNFLGNLQEVRLSISLAKYVPFIVGQATNFDTRYHIARRGDTYEMLCQREYGLPQLGVVIRQRHPTMPLAPTPGGIVKLPSIEGLRTVRIEPLSPMFVDLAKSTAAGVRFAELLAARSSDKLSKVLVS